MGMWVGQLHAQPQRIVSLLPSATESVCALGACQRLVGVDDYSKDPPHVLTLPRLGKTWQPNFEKILQLRPDLVLVAHAPTVTAKLQALGLRVMTVDAVTMADAFHVLRRLDQVLATEAAERVIAEITQSIQALHVQAQHLPPQRVYVEVDAALYAAGPQSYLGELLTQLGAHNIVHRQGGGFPKLSPEYVVAQAPDLVIQTYAPSAEALAHRPGWQRIPAVRQQRICPLTADERRVVTRPGPRIYVAAQVLLRCMQMPFFKRDDEAK